MTVFITHPIFVAFANVSVTAQLSAQPKLGSQVEWKKTQNLAKERVMVGLSRYSYLPFIKVSLPIKALPDLKEGTYGTGRSDNFGDHQKSRPSERDQSFRLNWLLGREGEKVVSKALGQAIRRLDVDAKFRCEAGVIPEKDQVRVI